jgi:hypothetical protein
MLATERVLICVRATLGKVGQSIEHEKADPAGRRRPTLHADAGGNSRQSVLHLSPALANVSVLVVFFLVARIEQGVLSVCTLVAS